MVCFYFFEIETVFEPGFSFAPKRKLGAQASEGIGELAQIDQAKLFFKEKAS